VAREIHLMKDSNSIFKHEKVLTFCLFIFQNPSHLFSLLYFSLLCMLRSHYCLYSLCILRSPYRLSSLVYPNLVCVYLLAYLFICLDLLIFQLFNNFFVVVFDVYMDIKYGKGKMDQLSRFQVQTQSKNKGSK